MRGFIRWKVPLNYVQELPESLEQNIRGIPFIQRITDFDPVQFKRVFINWLWYDDNGQAMNFNETNPLITILKNSIFSEFISESDFESTQYMLPLCTVFFWLGVILAAAAFIAMIATFIADHSMDRTQKLFIGSFYALLVGNLYLMSANYPMVCTMNFRYLMPTVITGALFVGMCIKKHGNKTADTVAAVPIVALGPEKGEKGDPAHGSKRAENQGDCGSAGWKGWCLGRLPGTGEGFYTARRGGRI